MQKFAVIVMICFALSTSRAFSRSSQAGVKNFASRLLSLSGGALPDNEELKPFYALGVNVAKQVGGELKGILTEEELKIMVDGFADSLSDKVPDDRSLLATYGPKLNLILQGRANAVLDGEKQKGKDFAVKYLLSNPKAIQSPSGLIFNEIIAGVGAKANPKSTVTVHYHGTLTNGNVFDSSVNRGEPISFPLPNVIKGWQEGVSLMREGGKATLVVPSDLAYGDNGSPPVIPPGATLIFEVELISVA